MKLIEKFETSLVRNSWFLLLNSFCISGFGYIFWMVCAWIYSSTEVGIAVTLISLINIILTFSKIGLNTSLVRFPINEKRVNFTFALLGIGMANIITIILSTFIIIIFPNIYSNLNGFFNSLLPSIVFILVTSIYLNNLLLDSIITGLKRSEFVFIRNFSLGCLKIGCLFVIAKIFGVLGIFGSWGFSGFVVLVVGISIIFILNHYPINKGFVIPLHNKELREIIIYSGNNYFLNLLAFLPGYIFPVILTTSLGPEKSAFFYTAWMIYMILATISGVTALSIIAEGSEGKIEREQVKKAGLFIFGLLIPAVIVVLSFGDVLLEMFGKEYSTNGIFVLRILTLSAIPVALNNIYIGIQKRHNNLIPVFLINLIITITSVSLTLFFIPLFGINAIGFAWIISNTAAAMGIMVKQYQVTRSRMVI
ncbi:MAG: lipopolysaccharide biosynthesis protein [Candidatus Hodarchaeales archaeon]